MSAETITGAGQYNAEQIWRRSNIAWELGRQSAKGHSIPLQRSASDAESISGLDFLLEELTEEEALPWQEEALCAETDPEAFFPEKGGNTQQAKRVCSRCEVRGYCLEYALANNERFGIWGGLSERERRRLNRRAR